MKFSLGKSEGIKVKFVCSNEGESCGCIGDAFKNKLFKGTVGETFVGKNKHDDLVLYVGVGEVPTLEDYKFASYSAIKFLISKEFENANICIHESNLDYREMVLAAVEGAIHGNYRFDKFKTDKKDIEINEISLILKQELDNIEEDIDELVNKMDGVITARNLVNEPSMYLYPETLAQIAKETLEPLGVKVTVYDKAQIEEFGMTAFLSVGRGSAKEPKLIVMEYNDVSNNPIALVGKGLTYDSGGYSLKPSDGMKTMQSDMGGSASVIGAMQAIASNKLNANVVGIVAACENMVSGDSYKPGDLIYSMSGKTIEIDNADAEGRVTLADAVYFATDKYSPAKIVDLATLTGACVVALGEVYTGAITNDPLFLSNFLDSAKNEDECVWELPNDEKYKELNKSTVADIKNSGGRLGGAITAGQFVGEFLKNDIPWIHLDIAGTAFLGKSQKYLPAGGTGVMVKTLYNYVKNNG